MKKSISSALITLTLALTACASHQTIQPLPASSGVLQAPAALSASDMKHTPPPLPAATPTAPELAAILKNAPAHKPDTSGLRPLIGNQASNAYNNPTGFYNFNEMLKHTEEREKAVRDCFHVKNGASYGYWITIKRGVTVFVPAKFNDPACDIPGACRCLKDVEAHQ